MNQGGGQTEAANGRNDNGNKSLIKMKIHGRSNKMLGADELIFNSDSLRLSLKMKVAARQYIGQLH